MSPQSAAVESGWAKYLLYPLLPFMLIVIHLINVAEDRGWLEEEDEQ
jgi:hypothetical protein